MKILLWGISGVGKTEVGGLLAKKLNYKFFNINDIIKQKYKTIDKFHERFPNDYDRFKEKEKIALDIINHNDDFILLISLIYIEEIVKNITNTDTVSVELVDSVQSIYNRTLFYDENDQVMPDSKEYLEAHKKHYWNEIKNDKRASYLEYRDIPKFNLKDRKFEDVIDELYDYIFEIAKKGK